MNYIDIILLLFLALFAWQGFRKGFVIEVASLAALILGIYAALYFSGYVSGFLVDYMNMGPKYVPVVAFIITFIVIVFLVYSIGKILEKLINMVALGFLNKIAGGVFGVLKGAVIVSIVLMIINHFTEHFISEEKREGSLLYEPLEGIAPMLWDNIKNWELDDPKIKDMQEDMEKITV